MYRPKITISWYVHELISRIHYDKRWKDKEWSCYVRLTRLPQGEGWKVVDLYFPKQKNSKAHTEIVAEGKATFSDWVVDRNPEESGEWFCWMHSHNSMDAFRSGEDCTTRNNFYLNGCKSYLSIVTATGGGENKIASSNGPVYYNGTFDVFHPGRAEFNCDISVESRPDMEGADIINNEFDLKSKEIVDKFSVVNRTPMGDIIQFLKSTFNTSSNIDDVSFGLNDKMRDDELLRLEIFRESKLNSLYDNYYDYTGEKNISFATKIAELAKAEINTPTTYGSSFIHGTGKGKKKENYTLYEPKKVNYQDPNRWKSVDTVQPLEVDEYDIDDTLYADRDSRYGDDDLVSDYVTWVDTLVVGDIIEDLYTGIRYEVTNLYTSSATISNIYNGTKTFKYKEDLLNSFYIYNDKPL